MTMPDDVHPQIQAIIDRMEELNIPKVQNMDHRAARQMIDAMSAARAEDYPPPAVAAVENTSTGAGYGHVPVRIYRVSEDGAAPAIVFFHGGGHVFGSLDTHDTVCRYLARVAGATIVSVDYRMGPEHPFPAAIEDCRDATRWVNDQAKSLRIDPERLAVAGDSAGGNLAVVTALIGRDSGAYTLSAQALIYPVIDYRGGTPSYEIYGQGYGVLESETVAWFRDRYLPDPATHDDWRACPRNASLAGLPPTFVLTAECDVLRDEGHAFAKQMQAAGVAVETAHFPGMIHGFFGYLGLVDDTEAAHRQTAAFLGKIWNQEM